MRKYFISIVSVLLLVVVLCSACTKKTSDKKTIYETLDSLVKCEYDFVELKISMTIDEKNLVGNYTIYRQDDVLTAEYTYQRFAKFKEIDGELIAPENEVETLSGRIVMQNDQLVDENGDNLNISVDMIKANGFVFDKSNFENTYIEENRFAATVIDPYSFMGIEEATDMTVEVDFTEERISDIVVKYSVKERYFILEYAFQ